HARRPHGDDSRHQGIRRLAVGPLAAGPARPKGTAHITAVITVTSAHVGSRRGGRWPMTATAPPKACGYDPRRKDAARVVTRPPSSTSGPHGPALEKRFRISFGSVDSWWGGE